MHHEPSLLRYRAIISAAVALVLLLSSHWAYLNPRPGFEPNTKLFERYPLLWQYNKDSPVQFQSAAGFPHYFKDVPYRVNRPVYPAVVCIISHPLRWALGLAIDDQQRTTTLATAIAYVTLKSIVNFLGAHLLFSLVLRWASPSEALLAVLLLLAQRFTLQYFATFHTTDLQIFNPIFVVWGLVRWSEKPSRWGLVWYSLLVGVCMLAKQNYAVYLAVLGYWVLSGKLGTPILSGLIHLLPLAAWLGTIQILGIPYYNAEMDRHGQGVWLAQTFLSMDVGQQAREVGKSVAQYGLKVAQFFDVLLPLALIGLALGWSRLRERFSRPQIRGAIALVVLLAAATWLQIFAAKRYIPYMTSDLVVVILPLAAVGLFQLARRAFGRGAMLVCLAFVVCFLGYQLSRVIHLPWTAPAEHGPLAPHVEQSASILKHLLTGN